MFGLLLKKPDDLALRIKQALGPDVAAVLSASCCMPGTQEVDGRVESVARAALAEAGLNWPVLTFTVTQAQSTLGRIAGDLVPAEAQLAQQISELFMSSGLSAFPVLLLNQRLLSYGGVPDLALLRAALPVGPLASDVGHEKAA